MANEYIANHEDILAVADAIREKAETADPLIFPDDFLSALASLEIGSGLPVTISAISAGTFTPSGYPTQQTIEHGMGVAPNFYMIRDTDQMGYNTHANKILAMYSSSFSSQPILVLFYANSTTSTFTARTMFGSTVGNATSITTPVISSSYAFQSGHTYHWLCGVIELK